MKKEYYRKPVNTDNYQQYLKPSDQFVSLLNHGHPVTENQLDEGIVVGHFTHGWHYSEYWLPLIMVEGRIYIRGGKRGIHKMIANSLDELSFKVKSGLLKFHKI